MKKSMSVIVGAAAFAAAAGPACARPAHDTLNFAINDPFPLLDPYNFPQDEAGSLYRTVYSSLIAFNEYKQKFVPVLATSWKRVSPAVLEFELNKNIKFHNGNKFDADDVVATINFITDPKTRIRFKSRFDWAKAEKLGPYKVRITAKKPFSTDMSNLAYRFRMLDAETMAKVGDVANYGREAPNGTGPYKVTSIDQQKGIGLEAVHNTIEKLPYYRAPAEKLYGYFISDRQTQIAELLTGKLDLLRNITADDAKQLAGNPDFKVTATPAANLIYVTLDAVGRSDSKIFTDERVRKAFIMSIPREKIVKTLVPGGDIAEIPASICFKTTTSCAPTTQPYPYNPSEAKKLLAEAGYPNGIDYTLKVFAPIKYLGEAIAGAAREVGFRGKIESLPLSLYVKQRGNGEFTAFVGYYPTSSQPDTTNLLDFFFGANRDYWKDPEIHAAAEAGQTEFDVAKRTKLFTPALDRVNEKAYILPLSELPIVFGHTKKVKVLRNPLSTSESRLGDYAWADYKEK